MSHFLAANDPQCVAHVVEALQRGGIVCLPTETVYGLVCSASCPDSIERLANIKKRPSDKPFALFVSSWKRMETLSIESCPIAERLAEVFWPGPLTLVIPAREDCPCSYQGSVGVRCPDHSLVQTILREYEGLLCNTSLNRSGEPEFRSLDRSSEFLKEIDLSVDGGILPDLKPSTVVDCRVDPPVILREGKITLSMVHSAISKL